MNDSHSFSSSEPKGRASRESSLCRFFLPCPPPVVPLLLDPLPTLLSPGVTLVLLLDLPIVIDLRGTGGFN